ncbi:MAG: transcription-repair coupling factor [Acidobacteriota bacterium]|nr:transcription-repair coupling factor [Acidobacteriota bacterium]
MTGFDLYGCEKIRLHGLRGSAGVYHLTTLGGKCVVVAPDDRKLSDTAHAVSSFRPDARVLVLPSLDTGPFSFAPVHPSTRRTRLLCFQALHEGNWDYLVTTARCFLEPIPPTELMLSPQLFLEEGGQYDLAELARNLAVMGYLSCDIVSQPGDFARRGGILDICSFTDEKAYRLEFFDDELEEIRTFDPATQRGSGNVDAVTILPLFEWTITPERAATFSTKGGSLWNQTDHRDHFLELVAQVRDRGRFPGYLHWTPLFCKETIRFFDLIDGPFQVYLDDWDTTADKQEIFLSHLEQQIEAIYPDVAVPAMFSATYGSENPRRIQLPEEATVLASRQLKLDVVDRDYATQTVPHYQNDVARFFTHWRPQAKRLAIVLVCRTPGIRKRFEEMLIEDGEDYRELQFPLPDTLKPGFYLALGHLETGFSWPDLNLVVVSEQDVFSKSGKPRSRAKMGKKIFQSEFRDLKVGDFVVHLDHGVGRFIGLVDMDAGGATHEMMALEYRDNQKLYVNLNQLDLIQRYGSDTSGASLDKLGGISWSKTRSKIKKAVREMAGELIKLYAARQVVGGRKYGVDTEWQSEFEDAFEYEPTDGQLAAVADIKRDLESNRPMDRLLVGDVGFGKTEVAMRLAFKAVMEGLQVAVLCPTTVLAFQHYHTFRNRFSAFPVTIGQISRFTSPKDTKEVLKQTAKGDIDILIGTHRVLSKDVQFMDLGVVVVDEEQRFGVAHKEKLKHMRKQVDVLSMSATPIPRTLNMSMSGIRDISVIETPPRNRLAISTTVAEARQTLIKNAVEFELQRDGQVFFIHNRVESMETVVTNLKKLVPGCTVGMAHGQMDSGRIEKVMLAFMRKEIDVLVASTIIENGVDISNANTMIVNRADLFGVSQLYQLRGRIGRSDRPAYAYLLVPPRARMSSLARKRLATLEEFSDLGSGFRIAAMDMELRGAGNLLGAEQAGHIHAVGYETYIKLLEEAVEELKGGKIEDEVNCQVKLQLGSAIPRGYIEEANQRLHYYKKLATARTAEQVTRIRETLRDVFGPLPAITERLCDEHDLRISLSARKILAVERERDRLKLRFHKAAEVNSELIFNWVQERRGITVSPDGQLTLPLEQRDPEIIMGFVRETVDSLLVA